AQDCMNPAPRLALRTSISAAETPPGSRLWCPAVPCRAQFQRNPSSAEPSRGTTAGRGTGRNIASMLPGAVSSINSSDRNHAGRRAPVGGTPAAEAAARLARLAALTVGAPAAAFALREGGRNPLAATAGLPELLDRRAR